jgi:hypothetical protein
MLLGGSEAGGLRRLAAANLDPAEDRSTSSRRKRSTRALTSRAAPTCTPAPDAPGARCAEPEPAPPSSRRPPGPARETGVSGLSGPGLRAGARVPAFTQRDRLVADTPDAWGRHVLGELVRSRGEGCPADSSCGGRVPLPSTEDRRGSGVSGAPFARARERGHAPGRSFARQQRAHAHDAWGKPDLSS